MLQKSVNFAQLPHGTLTTEHGIFEVMFPKIYLILLREVNVIFARDFIAQLNCFSASCLIFHSVQRTRS